MRGPEIIPSINERASIYDQILWSPQTVTIEQFILWSQWVRFDPRLGEILISFMVKHYESYNPLKIWKSLQQSCWPQTFLVLTEFAKNKISQENKKNLNQFMAWKKTIEHHFNKIAFQNFYIGLDSLNPEKLIDKINHSLKPYLKWGFWGVDDLNNLHNLQKLSLVQKKRRVFVLEKLLHTHKEISVKDYRLALNNNIHIRQAERDLKTFPKIKTKGFTRNRVYFL